jgi:hypothetical protein
LLFTQFPNIRTQFHLVASTVDALGDYRLMHTWPSGLELSQERGHMATNIKKRRQLSDLFKEGVEVRFGVDPDTGKPIGKIGPFLNSRGERLSCPDDEVAMFIRPPDPLQREQAMREGQAKRARALIKAKRDEESEEHLTIMAFLADMSDETLIDYVLLADQMERRNEAEREILALDEWKDMTSYQDALRQFSDMSPEELEGNEEWEALLELDRKYGEQIEERERELLDAQRDVLRLLQREQVERKALEKRAELTGSQAFMKEYEAWMLYFSVRDVDNNDLMFFESARDFAAQPQQVRETIQEALMPFISEGSEAKNSRGAAPGSDLSAPPSEPVTSEPSTPEELTA